MARDVLSAAERLRAEGRPFALATVVATVPPTSGNPGDRAIILPDGHLEGWVGGSCSQPTVIRQALAALGDGQPRLIHLHPEPDLDAAPQPGVVVVPMTCAGQGALQIYVEPFLPRLTLAVIGHSPVARALARFGTQLDFEVWACDPEADMAAFPDADRLLQRVEDLTDLLTARHYVVVATFGHYDELALQAALASPASYIGLIASQKRMEAVIGYLEDRGISAEHIARVKRPLGIAGKMALPGEIALSVMAELILQRHDRVGLTLEAAPNPPRTTATDPICGMLVDVATAMYKTERNGQMYYFCCAGCQANFEAG